MKPHTAKLCLSVVLKHFWEIHRELFFLDIKVTISETSTEILRKFVFLTMFEKGSNPEENLDLFKQLFLIKPVKGININKTVFLHKVSHILLNYAFLLFWSIFGEIHRELFFLDIKVTISETSTEILRNFVFLTMFEKGKILRKIWICLNIFFLIKPVKGDKY